MTAAIRLAISQPTGTITSSNLLSLSVLNAACRGITNLTGINGALNLVTLDLGDNSIGDVSLLSSLTSLTTLRLKDNPITNLQSLSSLNNLSWLDASADPVSDLSPLASPAQLQTLVLNSCGYTNAAPFKNLTQVRTLFLQNNAIADLTDIQNLTNLTALYLPANQIANPGPLTNLVNLTLLQLDRNQCTNASFLGSLNKLAIVSLANNALGQFQLITPPIPGSVLFTDNFTRATNPAPISPWLIPAGLGGSWYVSGGTLQSGTNTPQSYAVVYVTNNFANCTMQAQVAFSNTNGWGGGVGACVNTATGARYAAWVYPENSAGGGDMIKLIKFSSWTTFGYRGTNWGFMATTNLAAVGGVGTNSHTVTLSLVNNQISVLYDGAQVISATDVEAQQYSRGAASLEMWTDVAPYTMSFNNAQVTGISTSPILSAVSSLNLSYNTLSNLASVSLLTNLAQLNLSSNLLTDVTDLTPLAQLGNLDLTYNSVANISPLAALTNLRALHLSGNQITSAAALAGLTALNNLDANQNALTDISSLQGLTNLIRLACSGNSISNIAGLQNLAALVSLDLHNNKIASCSSITGLTNLATLCLAWNPFTDATTLGTLPQLRLLDLSSTGVTNLSPLAGLAQLSTLNCASTPLADFSPLTNCAKLTQLDLSWTRPASFAVVQQLTNLTVLMADGLTNSSFPNLGVLPGLVYFSAYQSQFTNASFLSQNINLNFLQLCGNSIIDISPLAGLSNLVCLYLSDNAITNISALLALPRLANLDLHNNYLDLSTNSAAMGVIQTLIQRGVAVNYRPQFPLPAISSISNQTIGENGASLPLTFTYTQPAAIAVQSSNQTLITDAELSLWPFGYPGTLTMIPQTGQTGSTTITITATNPKGLSVSTSFTLQVVGTAAVNLLDPALNTAVRDQLDRLYGGLTDFDLSQLTTLTAVNQYIQSLCGLQAATNLHVLDLSFNGIADLSPLAGLTNLQSLKLSANNITNLSALAGLTSLTNLDISENSVQDCSPLENLTSLQTLSLGTNNFGSLDCLANLTNLVTLNARLCGLTNCNFAAALTNLTLLYLGENSITNLAPLDGLADLAQLDLSLNQVTNISSLTNLPGLLSLQLSYDPILSFNPLSALTNLASLALARDGLTNLVFLAPLTNLSWLDLSYNSLTNIAALGGLRSLTNLNLTANQITNISPLTNCPALVDLILSQNYIQSFSPTLALTNLSYLDIRLNNLNLAAPSVQSLVTMLQQASVYVAMDQSDPPPSINPIPSQLIPPNTPVAPVALSFYDLYDDPCTLTVNVQSSNPNIIPNSGLQISGFCNDLTLNIYPVPGLTGLSDITVTVTDLQGNSASQVFSVEVLVNEPVSFPDPALLAVLQSNIEVHRSLTLYDMRGLLYLYASQSGITNIEGIEPAINLQYADLSYNEFTNALPLAGLTNMQTLILDGDDIGSLAFASNLTGFSEVSFEDTGIKNISPLANKTNLVYLDLSYNIITNLYLLTNLDNLTTLTLDDTGLQDISFLTNLSGLQFLGIAGNNITNLAPLLALPNLVSVDIYGNGLDLSPGSANAAVLAELQEQGVFVPDLQQVSQPQFLSGSPLISWQGGPLLQFSGVPGRYYNIQASTNLMAWTNLASVLCTSETTSYYDSNYAAFTQRFYRLQQGAVDAILTVTNVTLGLPVKNTNGNYSLPVTANAVKTFVLQTSTDLANWSSLSTNTSINGSLLINGATNISNRQFYRLLFP